MTRSIDREIPIWGLFMTAVFRGKLSLHARNNIVVDYCLTRRRATPAKSGESPLPLVKWSHLIQPRTVKLCNVLSTCICKLAENKNVENKFVGMSL